jgi:adenylate cyclase
MQGPASALDEPACGAIRGELRRILASKVFADSPRASRFLSYVVEETLQNRSPNLKEYIIGVEVYDRGELFDPKVDTIVRVEASRLRTRLKRYYETEAGKDSVRIDLPRGHYAPVFSIPSTGGGEEKSSSRLRRVLGVSGAIMIAAAVAVQPTHLPIRRVLPIERAVAVLPFVNVGGDLKNQALCDGLIETLTNRLGELEELQNSFWMVAASDVRESGIRSAEKALRTFGATLAVTGSVQREAGSVRVAVNIVDTSRSRQLGSRLVEIRNAEFYALQDEVGN